MLKQIKLRSLLVLFILLSAAGIDLYGQCGVYLKHTSTQAFPYPAVYLDRATDMTGDGLPDLVASQNLMSSQFQRNRVFIIPNIGNGRFGPPSTIFEPPTGVTFSDAHAVVNINNDTNPDFMILLGGNEVTGYLIYVNNGNGTFTALTPTNFGAMGRFVGMADIDGDGTRDYLGFTGSEMKYSLGNGDGTFDPPVTLFTNDGAPSTGEFNGDGNVDFIDTRHLHLNNGDGTFGTTDLSGLFLSNEVVWGIADFNVDGKMDLLVKSLTGTVRNFAVLRSTGTTFTRTDFSIGSDPDWDGFIVAGDFSGNSAPDIVWQPRYVSKKAIFTNDGTGNFTRTDYDGRLFNSTGQQSVGADFDNDGKLDFVQATSGITNSRIMLRDVTSFSFLKRVCDLPGQPRIVDYDRSNTTDWSFWNPTTGDWSRRTNFNGSERVREETINWGLGSLGDIPSPGDFDGDGITDRAVYRDSTGYWYIRKGSDASWFVMRFGLTGDEPVAADYDGDSITDIAVWRPSDGNWYIWYMGTQSFYAQHFGSDGDKPVPADFDGDLKTDVAVYRPSTGVWYYYKSSDGNYGVVPWGIATDRPIPADFDGDGKADITVYRESDKFAYILRSTTGYTTASYYQFGLAGDILQPGDYDGDYVADLGVYRPSNQTWWTTVFLFGQSQTYGVPNGLPTSSVIKFE